MKPGVKGEKAAAAYLKKEGLEIIETNYRYLHTEIDIVAREGNEIVFVEVKTRKQNPLIAPATAVNRQKQKNVIKAAEAYINSRNIELDARFDIVCIIENEGQFEIEHIRQAYYPTL